jgi:large subunit ribosomal protein L3
MNFIVGKKLNMSQYFDQSGQVIPVTVLKVNPLKVTQVKTKEGKDAYNAVQVGVPASIKGKRTQNKALTGHSKGGKFGSFVEFRTDKASEYEVGQTIDLTKFSVGEMVNVVGVMKGRGFQGVVKRHNFAGFPASHGHNKQRVPGSIGQRYPQHTRKGLRMAGHMGDTFVTVKNLQIVELDPARGLVSLKGAVPGSRGGMIKVQSTGVIKPLVVEQKVADDKKKK